MIVSMYPMGAIFPAQSLAARVPTPVPNPRAPANPISISPPVAINNEHVVGTESLNPPPAVPASQSVASSPAPAPASSSAAPSSLAQMVSGLVDPVTGLTYSGFLTPDAQTLYQSGSLVTGGNQLTSQGSALAAQGDLITGTPAPTTAQVAAASSAAVSPSGDSWSQIETWLSAETYVSGIPNGALLAGAAILGSLLFGGKKGRR